MYPSQGNQGERLARLEIRVENGEASTSAKLNEAKTDRQEIIDKLEKIDNKLTIIDRDLTKYKGIIGGITLVLSGIGILAVFFKGWILSRLGASS